MHILQYAIMCFLIAPKETISDALDCELKIQLVSMPSAIKYLQLILDNMLRND